MENFDSKEFREVPGGRYDENGFYITPEGSFWDPDGVYFNRDGFDKHGGCYDENFEYIPGYGWIDELMCYEDEKDTVLKQKHVVPTRQRGGGYGHGHGHGHHQGDEEDDGFDELDELYDDVDYAKILKDEELISLTEKFSSSIQTTPSTTVPTNTNITTNTNTSNTTTTTTNKPDETVSLFNKIPENKKPAEQKEKEKEKEAARKEKVVEVDSLFG
jgi:hypothetical protein